MPQQQHLYNGLARPADYSIFHGNGLARLWASIFSYRNELAITDNVLAYGHRGWPTAKAAGL